MLVHQACGLFMNVGMFMSDMIYFLKVPEKRRDFCVIVLNLNHLKSIGMAVVLEDGPGDAMFGMFSHFRLKITCVNGFW